MPGATLHSSTRCKQITLQSLNSCTNVAQNTTAYLEVVEGPVSQCSVLGEGCGERGAVDTMQELPASVTPEERVHQHRAEVFQDKHQLIADLQPSYCVTKRRSGRPVDTIRN